MLGCPGFGLKVTPKGRKVFVVLYRMAGARSRLCKYTIGPYGRVTLNQATLHNTLSNIDPDRKFHGCFAERSDRHGEAGAFTRSANAM